LFLLNYKVVYSKVIVPDLEIIKEEVDV